VKAGIRSWKIYAIPVYGWRGEESGRWPDFIIILASHYVKIKTRG
jgi:hypothetical protein